MTTYLNKDNVNEFGLSNMIQRTVALQFSQVVQTLQFFEANQETIGYDGRLFPVPILTEPQEFYTANFELVQ